MGNGNPVTSSAASGAGGSSSVGGGGVGGAGVGGGGSGQDLYPFCGCIEGWIQDPPCSDCLFLAQTGGCDVEWADCESDPECLSIINLLLDCPGVTAMCVDNSSAFATPGSLGAAIDFLSCACGGCSIECPIASCQ